MEKEITFLSKVLHAPEHPYVAILGGAKVSDKLGVIRNLAKSADKLLIGGAMAFTFLKAKGLGTGKSLVEEDRVDEVRQYLKDLGAKLVLPVDFVTAPSGDGNVRTRVVKAEEIPADEMGLDIGPASRELFAKALVGARMVVWNGPMGKFEISDFVAGTESVAQTIAGLKATTVVGGGDSVAALTKLDLVNRVTHVSTGGGASLEFLEGIELPGIKVLQNR